MELRSSVDDVVWPPVLTGRAAEVLALHAQLEQTQWWTTMALRAHQFRQLERLVRHATAHAPATADRLRAAGIDGAADLTEGAWVRLAPMTRSDIRREGARLHAAQVPPTHGPANEIATGGSTSIPVRVRKTALDGLFWSAMNLREEVWHRTNPRGTIARLRSLPSALSPHERAAAASPNGLMLSDWGPPSNLLWQTGRMYLLDPARPPAEQVATLTRLAPEYLLTTASYLRLLLASVAQTGARLASLQAVWVVSEVVDDALRARCQETLGVPIVANYSAAETGYLALQCPDGPQLHIMAEDVLVEVVDADNLPCPPGARGRLLVTCLHSFAMPLLRYELGDEAVLGGPCPCGRGLPVLAEVTGRSVDHLRLPDGSSRWIDVRHYRIARNPAVIEFQLAQRSLREIEIRLVTTRPLDAAEEAEIIEAATGTIGQDFSVRVSYHAVLPRTATGKLRAFVSEL